MDSKLIIDLYNKYSVPVGKNFVMPKITISKTSQYIQTASNCRIYNNLTNLALMTGIKTDGGYFEKFVEKYGKDNTLGGSISLGGTLLCEYRAVKNICMYELSLIKKSSLKKSVYTDSDFDKEAIKIRTRLLIQGVVFMYSRIHGKDLQNDIKDNDSVDKILSKENDTGRHATNIWFNPETKKLQEIGTRGDKNRYNEFVYGNTDWFIKSIKEKTINPVLRFIYFRQ